MIKVFNKYPEKRTLILFYLLNNYKLELIDHIISNVDEETRYMIYDYMKDKYPDIYNLYLTKSRLSFMRQNQDTNRADLDTILSTLNDDIKTDIANRISKKRNNKKSYKKSYKKRTYKKRLNKKR